jgi:hypothetical protein
LREHLPWYKLAQTIYESGKNCMERVKAGNNTFTLIFGETSTERSFYISALKENIERMAELQIK